MCENKNINFEKFYFEDWHAYNRKRTAIQMLYDDVLNWAINFVSFDLLNGKIRHLLTWVVLMVMWWNYTHD